MIFAPPFDHIVLRRGDKTKHTWKLGDVRLLVNSRNGYFVSSGTVADVERQMDQYLDEAASSEGRGGEPSLSRVDVHERESPDLRKWSAVLRGLVKWTRHRLGVAKQKFGFRP